MVVHRNALGHMTALIIKIRKRTDAELTRGAKGGVRGLSQKRKSYSAEALAKIAAFDAKHGVTRKPRPFPGLRNLQTRKKHVTLPKLNLPEDPGENS